MNIHLCKGKISAKIHLAVKLERQADASLLQARLEQVVGEEILELKGLLE